MRPRSHAQIGETELVWSGPHGEKESLLVRSELLPAVPRQGTVLYEMRRPWYLSDPKGDIKNARKVLRHAVAATRLAYFHEREVFGSVDGTEFFLGLSSSVKCADLFDEVGKSSQYKDSASLLSDMLLKYKLDEQKISVPSFRVRLSRLLKKQPARARTARRNHRGFEKAE